MASFWITTIKSSEIYLPIRELDPRCYWERGLVSYVLARTMPWHKVRVYYDREAERRRRSLYQVNLSLLIASAVLLLAIVIGIYPFVDFWFGLPAHSGDGQMWRVPGDSPDWPTPIQEVCGAVSLLCLIYISIVLNFRGK
jgi:hypothetical protein